jgi:large repetitive protein
MRYVRALLLAAGFAAIVAFGPEASAATTQIDHCNQTVTTSGVLTQNLFCQGMPGIVVGASGITIDLKGFRLRGDNTSGNIGVDDSGGFDKVTVKDGVVRNFDTGVYATGENVAVSDLVVSGNTNAGISVNGGGSAKITSVTASGNGSLGIAANSNSLSITSSAASGNASIGMEVGGDSVSVKSSTAIANGGSGIAGAADSVSVKSVTASGNGTYGIAFSTTSGISIASATASGNSADGINVSGPSVSIKSSVVDGNGNNGIVVDGNGASLRSNRADANGFPSGASDLAGLGILVHFTTTAPVGVNRAGGNDDRDECHPASLC